MEYQKNTSGEKQFDLLEFILRIIFWSAICLIFIIFFGSFIYYAFHTPSKFDDLEIKRGVLKEFGKRVNERHGPDYFPVKILIDGKIESLNLPDEQEVYMLGRSIGKKVEIRSDPHQLQIFSDSLNVWYVSTDKKVYFDYNKALLQYNGWKVHSRHIVFLTTIFMIIAFVLNYKHINNYFFKEKKLYPFAVVENPNEIIFKSSNTNMIVGLLISSYLSIFCAYFMFFLSSFFVLFAIPMMILSFYGYRGMKKNNYDITLSTNGISSCLFMKEINTDMLKWSEIEHIDTFRPRGTELIMIRLRDKNRISSLKKFRNLSYDLVFNPGNFEKSAYLKKMVFSMYHSAQNQNIHAK